MREITVIICTHNPREAVLAQVFEALAMQTLPIQKWEVLLVDNASIKPLQKESLKAHALNLTVVHEPQLGLSYARTRGLRESAAPYCVFVDDDNILDKDYLNQVLSFFSQNPSVGVAGGKITAKFDAPPPHWAIKHLSLLALRDHGDAPLTYSPGTGPLTNYPSYAPIGAGMALRFEVTRLYLDWIDSGARHLIGRRGKSLASGEDCDLVACALRAGWSLAYNPFLSVIHLIPVSRLRFRYLARLAFSSGLSWGVFLRREGLQGTKSAFALPLRLGRSLIRERAWTRSGGIAWFQRAGFFLGQLGY